MSYKAGTVIIDIKADTAKLVHGMDRAEKTVKKSIDSIKNTVLSLASAYAGFSGVEKILKDGFAFNKNMEESIAGLTALTVATSSNTSAMGKQLTIAEKYGLAQKEALKTAQELNKINAETPHTLEQTNQIYKAMYVSMKKAGASNEQMINLTKKVSIAAGAAGIQFNSLLAGVDGLATGTVLVNSDLGRFLSSLGLTNKKLKESKDVVKTLNNALKDFKAVDTMTVAVSNLENAWSQLAGTLTEDIFDISKQNMKSFTSEIVTLNDQWHSYLLQFKSVGDIQNIVDLNIKLVQLERERDKIHTKGLIGRTFDLNNKAKQDIQYAIDVLNLKKETLKHQDALARAKEKEVRDLKAESALSKKLNGLLNAQGTQKEKINSKYSTYKKLINSTFKDESSQIVALAKLDKWRNTELSKLQKKKESDFEKFANKRQAYWDKKLGKDTKDAEKFKTDWGAIISRTFIDSMQEAFDGNFDLSKLASGLAQTIGSSLSQAGMAQATKDMSSSLSSALGLGTGVAGGLATAGIGLAISGITTQLFSNSTDYKAEEARKKAIEQKAWDSLISNINKASDAFKKFGNNGESLASKIKSLESEYNKRASELIAPQILFDDKLGRIKAEMSDTIIKAVANNTDYSRLSTSSLNNQIGNFSSTSFKDSTDRLIEISSEMKKIQSGFTHSYDRFYNKDFISLQNEAKDIYTSSNYKNGVNNLDAVKERDSRIESSSKMIAQWDQRNETALQITTRLITAQDSKNKLDMTSEKTMRASIDSIWKRAKADGVVTQAEYDAAKSADELMKSRLFTIKSVFDSLAGAIDNLRGSAIGTSYSLSSYYDAMVKARRLKGSSDADAYSKAVTDAISKSSVLNDSSSFGSSRDQKFAQLVAANQFEDLQKTTVTQIDLLGKIEHNTRESATDKPKPFYYSFKKDFGFAVGTPSVPHDMTANIHQGEIIVPKTFSEGLRDGRLSMGSQDAVVAELKELRKDIKNLNEEVARGNMNTRSIDRNTRESRIAS